MAIKFYECTKNNQDDDQPSNEADNASDLVSPTAWISASNISLRSDVVVYALCLIVVAIIAFWCSGETNVLTYGSTSVNQLGFIGSQINIYAANERFVEKLAELLKKKN